MTMLITGIVQSFIIFAFIIKYCIHDCKKARRQAGRQQNRTSIMRVGRGQPYEEEMGSGNDEIELHPIVQKQVMRLRAPTPKPLENLVAELNIQENEAFITVENEKDKVFCIPCGTTLSIGCHNDLRKHCKRESHIRNRNLKAIAIEGKEDRNKDLAYELCKVMVVADLPWQKIEIPEFRNFLELNIGRKFPSRVTLVDTYLDKLYLEAVSGIKQDLSNGPVWCSVDGNYFLILCND